LVHSHWVRETSLFSRRLVRGDLIWSKHLSPSEGRPGAAAPLAKVTGVIVTVRVRLRAGGWGAKHPRLGPRSGNFAGLKGSEASFMRK
jgi:hypothetical protein